MKRIIIFTYFLFVSFDCFSNVYISNYTHSNDSLYNRIIRLIAGELHIDSITIFIANKNYNTDLQHFEEGRASVSRISKNQFIINVDETMNKYQLAKAIIHELVHIKQMLDRRLVIQRFSVYFEGILYSNKNSDYDARPYEKEAFKMANLLYDQFNAKIMEALKA